jgi:(R,R)-butanediol dehydrogenase/meso-butanediol dehydrogenase/diacetyl reductase
MKALRWHGRRDVRLDDVRRPDAPTGAQLELAVSWCGICATDVEEWQHGPIFVPTQPNPLTGAQAPLTLGHEIVGEVVRIGEAVENFAVGDRVAVDGLMGCGLCEACRADRVMLCPSLAAVGLMADGGLAEYVLVSEDVCEPVPAGVEDEAAALAETLAVGVRALNRGCLAEKDRVLVVGGGAIGLLAAQAARAMGAREVAVVEPLDSRRAIAEGLGLTTVPALEPDHLADLVLECSGRSHVVRDAIRATAPAGRLVLVGIYSDPVEVNPLDLVRSERSIIGTLSHRRAVDFRAALDLLAEGAVDASAVISDRISLDSVIERGLMALMEFPAAHIKIVVSPRLKGHGR